MKNLIFKRDRLSGKVTLLAYDSNVFNIVASHERLNFHLEGYTGKMRTMKGDYVGHKDDTSFIFHNRNYYQVDGYEGLTMDELWAVADTNNETLIRFVFIENGFSESELDDCFDAEDVYQLLKR